ncbi:ABC transporter permease subunit [Paraburkholderia haematera]|jgi:ABC-type spermidine/putrescine transport system, permease component II|uniref:Inner membrane ABC transporter permease protein YdcV n=1 Tax=Paraburkholderia haematera TaxID=2793077 RepID=A0ABM8RPM5_9BURK|nr:ABC transporter permease subunit [Paraburkholderia haematera]CAE6764977.1 Inner membrane ABC transporter permease protein YdcV [Paraburkholderia haematera]
MRNATDKASTAVLALGFLFLYLPIASVVFYSFNDSRLVSVWSHFSFRWYTALASDDELINAATLSLKIALLTACASTFVGTWAGFILARFNRFQGRTLFSLMINAPLVIPEVITGISLLLLFVAMEQVFGWPRGRGWLTMAIGHTVLCVSYVAIVVQSRVKELDKATEEAALDLGAGPLRVFFYITLPLISQAVGSGWLLSFTISVDDLILSAFLSGPGSTTLPLVVFSRVRLGMNPEMNALAAVIIAVVTLGVFVLNRSVRNRGESARQIAAQNHQKSITGLQDYGATNV